MAALAGAGFGSSFMSAVPLFGVGMISYLVATNSGHPPPRKEPSKEERISHQQMTELDHTGANASFWQALTEKQHLFGLNGKRETSLDVRNGGYNENPNQNSLNEMFQDHTDLAKYDRDDTYLSLWLGSGEVRPKRNMPIVATLTPEIFDPSRPSHVTDLSVYKHFPAEPNAQQRLVALRGIEADRTRPDQMLRHHYDIEYLNRAPGQSFRYESNE